MYMMMKKLLILWMVFGVLAVQAQQMPQERLKEQKEKFLKERLQLSEEQDGKFFSLYEEFNMKRRDMRIEMSQNRLGLKKSSLSDAEAKKIIETELRLKKELVGLEEEYYKKYSGVLSSKQIIELYRAEDDFNKIMMQRLNNRPNRQQPQGGGAMRNRNPGNTHRGGMYRH